MKSFARYKLSNKKLLTMKKINSYFLIIVSALLLMSTSFSACKELAPPKAIVTVYKLDPSGNKLPVINCEVRLDPPSGTTQPELIEYTNKVKLTDALGQVEYDFTYEGIITVIAQKGDGEESCGQGVLILKKGEVYHEDIRLSTCYD